jgi:hypothetical protein
MGARYYDADTSRFLTRDPIGYGGGMNVYAYCGDDPINNADPTGLADGYWGQVGDFAEGELGSFGNFLVEENTVVLALGPLVPEGVRHPFQPGAGSSEGERNGYSTGAAIAVVGSLFVPVGGETMLAKEGEDLYVGTYGSSRAANVKCGVADSFVPHHAIHDAVNSGLGRASRRRGITINLPRDIHRATETYSRPARVLPSVRHHMAADVRELRNLLGGNGYGRSGGNQQLMELIRQSKALGGLEK